MANKRGKSIDTTYLSIAGQVAKKGFIHRDYLAHCLRYSHVAKFMNESHRYATAHVLDVGCGREVPLARLLYSMMMTHTTGSYTGVDYGPVPWPDVIQQDTKKFKLKLLERADFSTVELPRKKFDVITSFEVLEHVEAIHCFKMLQRMRSVVSSDGTVFLSTPCYDQKVGAADNHVNEMSHDGFKALLLGAGFRVSNVWGTFASQKDYKKLLTEPQRLIFDQLSSYYDSNVVACLFAPLFPEQSRNCIWELKPSSVKAIDQDDLKRLARPEHGSSVAWSKQLKQIAKEIAS